MKNKTETQFYYYPALIARNFQMEEYKVKKKEIIYLCLEEMGAKEKKL